MKKTQGFTLIELLVVIAIIGILSSVVLVSLSGTRVKAKTVAFKQEVSSIVTGLVDRCDTGSGTGGITALSQVNVFGLAAFTTFIATNRDISSTGFDIDCTDSTFHFWISPNTGFGGVCSKAEVRETGVTFTGC